MSVLDLNVIDLCKNDNVTDCNSPIFPEAALWDTLQALCTSTLKRIVMNF